MYLVFYYLPEIHRKSLILQLVYVVLFSFKYDKSFVFKVPSIEIECPGHYLFASEIFPKTGIDLPLPASRPPARNRPVQLSFRSTSNASSLSRTWPIS